MVDDDYLRKTDFIINQDRRELARMRRHLDIEPQKLSDKEVSELIAFLESLTDDASLYGRLGPPKTVPSGIAVD